MKSIRIVLAQINSTVGDITGNTRKIISFIKKAKTRKADIVVFPELAVTGYPPEDLLMKDHFVEDNMNALLKIRDVSSGITVITGFVDRNNGIYNAAVVVSNRKIIDIYHKKHLPNYGVFDEYRYFLAGKRFPVYDIGGVRFGLNICEDIWYEKGPAKIQALAGAQLIININASPYHMGKGLAREELISGRALECGAPIVYLNLVGGQDELIFDGGSLITDSSGNIILRGRRFDEDLIAADIEVHEEKPERSAKIKKELRSLLSKDETIDLIKIPAASRGRQKKGLRNRKPVSMSDPEKIYNALLMGTKDYVRKNGFKGVIIGMSGGIDSALVATVAVDALGQGNVHAIFMPSVYTSEESYEDAVGHAENLGIEIRTIHIDSIFKTYLETLSESFSGAEADTTEENLQARIRGNILMAFSNKFGWLVLTTGNKSEMSVGYATLYGDMAGGFAVIKDVPKTLVYELCEWRNSVDRKAIIPARILTKEPTAELRPDQKDTDSLPPYPVLDPVLKAYVEEDRSFEEIKNMGCDPECAKRIIRMTDLAEYKRRQAPPGIKITPRAFGKDRRFPITNRYRSY